MVVPPQSQSNSLDDDLSQDNATLAPIPPRQSSRACPDPGRNASHTDSATQPAAQQRPGINVSEAKLRIRERDRCVACMIQRRSCDSVKPICGLCAKHRKICHYPKGNPSRNELLQRIHSGGETVDTGEMTTKKRKTKQSRAMKENAEARNVAVSAGKRSLQVESQTSSHEHIEQQHTYGRRRLRDDEVPLTQSEYLQQNLKDQDDLKPDQLQYLSKAPLSPRAYLAQREQIDAIREQRSFIRYHDRGMSSSPEGETNLRSSIFIGNSLGMAKASEKLEKKSSTK